MDYLCYCYYCCDAEVLAEGFEALLLVLAAELPFILSLGPDFRQLFRLEALTR